MNTGIQKNVLEDFAKIKSILCSRELPHGIFQMLGHKYGVSRERIRQIAVGSKLFIHLDSYKKRCEYCGTVYYSTINTRKYCDKHKNFRISQKTQERISILRKSRQKVFTYTEIGNILNLYSSQVSMFIDISVKKKKLKKLARGTYELV